MNTRVRSWAGITVGGLPLPDLLVALVLSAGAIVVVSATPGADTRLKVVGSVAVLTMTLPVAWVRRAPVGAAAALAAGSVLNAVVIGSMVRCGATLQAAFIAAFAVAARCRRAPAWLGLAFCLVNVLAQTASDPRLGISQFPLMLVVSCVFFALGRIARSHAAAVDTLRTRTAELRAQREQTEDVARRASRAQVTTDVDASLRTRLSRIAATACESRRVLAVEPRAAIGLLELVENEGREALQELRRIVGSLDPVPPTGPQPALADLTALLARATSADARLSVEGDERTLPAGIELTAFRITERLVAALDDAPEARIDVRLRFESSTFQLQVSGPPARDVELAAVLAAARERAALYGGTLEGRLGGGLYQATARLPLVAHGA